MKRYRGIRVGRFNFYFGKVARGNNGVNQPWMGYCYGSWLPRFQRGRYPSSVYMDVSWLCFHATAYKETP